MTQQELDNPLPRNGIQVIGRAAAVLRALRDDPVGLSLGQIAERVGLPRSTVQRIVAALQEERLVMAMGNGGIRLGPEITTLAAAAKFNVVDFCRPFLNELVQRTGETADLSVLRGLNMVFLDQIPGTHRLRAVSSVGEVFPLTTTANGRAALAALPEPRARRLSEDEWKAAGTPDDWDGFSRMLSDVRATGLAFDCDMHTAGISAVGMAFSANADETYAISVPVPTHRFHNIRDFVSSEVAKVKQKISAQAS